MIFYLIISVRGIILSWFSSQVLIIKLEMFASKSSLLSQPYVSYLSQFKYKQHSPSTKQVRQETSIIKEPHLFCLLYSEFF